MQTVEATKFIKIVMLFAGMLMLLLSLFMYYIGFDRGGAFIILGILLGSIGILIFGSGMLFVLYAIFGKKGILFEIDDKKIKYKNRLIYFNDIKSCRYSYQAFPLTGMMFRYFDKNKYKNLLY
jgi:hypothetical protein